MSEPEPNPHVALNNARNLARSVAEEANKKRLEFALSEARRWPEELTDEEIALATGYKLETKRVWWCNTHQREAINARGCDPKLGGILMPCRVVDLTGIAEVGVAEVMRDEDVFRGTGPGFAENAPPSPRDQRGEALIAGEGEGGWQTQRVLIWLGYWRNQMPERAVTELQDILGV